MNSNESWRLKATSNEVTSFVPVGRSPDYVLYGSQEVEYQPNGGPIENSECIDFRVYDMWDRAELPPSPQYYHDIFTYAASVVEPNSATKELNGLTEAIGPILQRSYTNSDMEVQYETPDDRISDVNCGELHGVSGVRDDSTPDVQCGGLSCVSGVQDRLLEKSMTINHCCELESGSEFWGMHQENAELSEPSTSCAGNIPPTVLPARSSFTTALSTGGLSRRQNTLPRNANQIPPGAELTTGNCVGRQSLPPLLPRPPTEAIRNNARTGERAGGERRVTDFHLH
ncbi:hypothetical protein TcWFU_004180 [Taenia crassiceps]|uniref:Uncharacterized protein n=1 Tax=Taenia crassiceps TaxID=6207 RepID=A0ABR4Q673_9CEST